MVVVGRAEGSCVSRGGPREEGCVWWAVGSGPKRDLREGEKCRGGKKLFTRVMLEIQVLTSVGAQKRLAKKEPLCARDATVTAHCEAGLFVAILMYL